MPLLSLAGDALWIIALSIMAGGSRSAWGRIAPETKIPLQFAQNGAPTWRFRRNIALIAFPAIAFVVGVLLVLFNRNVAANPNTALIFFGVRATVAALFAIMHLRWLTAALELLDREGLLKPLP
jgi:hypothetical protein